MEKSCPSRVDVAIPVLYLRSLAPPNQMVTMPSSSNTTSRSTSVESYHLPWQIRTGKTLRLLLDNAPKCGLCLETAPVPTSPRLLSREAPNTEGSTIAESLLISTKPHVTPEAKGPVTDSSDQRKLDQVT